MTEPQLRDLMDSVGRSVESTAAGYPFRIKHPLFVTLLFNDPKVAQYVCNCNRSDMIKALREAADKLEQQQDVPR
jgi:hypothetical protein